MGMSIIKCAGCGAEKPPVAYPKRSGRQTRRGVCRACLRSRKRLRALGEEYAKSSAAQVLYGEQAAAREDGAEREQAEASVAAASEAAHSADAACAATAAGEASADAGEQPKRKRKRKRRRGKRAKKNAVSEAGLNESADSPSLLVSDAISDTTQDLELNDTDIGQSEGCEHGADVEAQFSEDIPDEQEQGKRKRKRKRRRRSKKSAKVTVSSMTEDEAGDAADQHLQEGELPANRKRKRKRRRRKSKRSIDGVAAAVEAEASKRPAVRPPNKRIVPFKGPFTYDTAILNDKGTGMIRLRGRRETGKRWHTEIEKDIAVRMVQEGAAGIIHPRLIHKLYTKSDFRLLILQRDNYVCRYCGQFGDTIDHVMPKSKGGLSTPMNCVCACSECNLLKADKLDFPYPDEPYDDSDE
jgi:hypothetical protein